MVSASSNVSCSNFMLILKNCAPPISVMLFQNGAVCQTLIVMASLVAKCFSTDPICRMIFRQC